MGMKKETLKKFFEDNKILIAVVAVLLIICGGCLTGYGVVSFINNKNTQVVTEVLSGTGTEADPFIISTAADLLEFNENVGNYNCTASGEIAYTTVTNDIDLEGADWYPIGTQGEGFCFTGIFDGGGYTISNCSIITTDYDHVGFFAAIWESDYETAIMNLNLEGVVIKTSTNHVTVGGLVGYAYADIIDCSVEAKITLYGDVYATGGIVGMAYGEVSGCFSDGSISVATAELKASVTVDRDYLYFGGVIGILHESGVASSLTNYMTVGVSLVSATQGATETVSIRTGGVIGQSQSNTAHSDLLNMANISGVGIVGGIIGDLWCKTATVEYCRNEGSIYSTSGIQMESGGIVGRSFDGESNIILECWNNGSVSGKSLSYSGLKCYSWVGGIIATGEVDIENCKSSGAITVTGEETNYVGGIVGGCYGVITNSYCSANITVDSDVSIMAGGIAGVLQDNLGISITSCYYSGVIIGRVGSSDVGDSVTVGGIMGYNMRTSDTVIANNYYDKEVIESSFVDNDYIKPSDWYGETDNEAGYTGSTISGNTGYDTEEMQGNIWEGFYEYDVDDEESGVWIIAIYEYPKLYWEA